MKKRSKSRFALVVCLVLILSMVAGGCGGADPNLGSLGKPAQTTANAAGEQTTTALAESNGNNETAAGTNDVVSTITPLERKKLVSELVSEKVVQAMSVVPKVEDYEPKADLSDIVNLDAFNFYDDQKEQLVRDLFFVTAGYQKEFFPSYETHRYLEIANFVTVDSMMHTYHLYFSYLLKNTERTYIAEELLQISMQMMKASQAQLEALIGTEWESAARRNVAFFTVGACLQNENVEIPSIVADMVNANLTSIINANGIEVSPVTGGMVDFSQFRPRGYYEGDAQLERYFRAMMWYGQIGFKQSEEDLDRSALLITLAMNDETLESWEKIYAVTSFFAGASDDLTYYEYRPAIDEAFGADVKVADLPGDEKGWDYFRILTDAMNPPQINSVPTADDGDPTEHATSANKGFRFMGQRFTIDEMIFQHLIYDRVQGNSSGKVRMLPDTLDVAAAFGSEEALKILEEQGATDYDGYSENLADLTYGIANAADSLWEASLYASWLFTLKPLLETKGEGYPAFMRGSAWARKCLETFGGSYAELKHDTILYAKQVMAEMGGGDLPRHDDRGYVEPELSVWARFSQLARKTSEGLETFGMLDDLDKDNLERLALLADDLYEISLKELNGEVPTDEQFDIIRYYGGTLEHFFKDAYRDKGENVSPNDYPAAIIADIATDPQSGTCLEVGTANPANIYVIFPIGNELHIGVGSIYSFYQFPYPISDRLTDSKWRQMMGVAVSDDGTYYQGERPEQPAWTQGYRYVYK